MFSHAAAAAVALTLAAVVSPPSKAQPTPTPAPASSPAPAAQSRSVYLDVKAATGGSSSVNWRSYYGSSSRTDVKSTQLEIRLRNMAHVPGSFTLEWIFFGRNGARRFIYDVGTEAVELPGGGTETTGAVSEELESSRYRSYYGYSYRSGDRPDGWLVLAKIGDEVIRSKGSSPQIEALGQSKPQLEKLLTDFKRSGRAN